MNWLLHVNRSCVGLSPYYYHTSKACRVGSCDGVNQVESSNQNLNVVWRIFEKAEIQYLTFEGRLKCGGEGLIVVKIFYCSNEGLNVEADI